MATAMLLQKQDIHFFDAIGYAHSPWEHVPLKKAFKADCDRSWSDKKVETGAPYCLHRWVEYHWQGEQLPFETHLEDVPHMGHKDVPSAIALQKHHKWW